MTYGSAEVIKMLRWQGMGSLGRAALKAAASARKAELLLQSALSLPRATCWAAAATAGCCARDSR